MRISTVHLSWKFCLGALWCWPWGTGRTMTLFCLFSTNCHEHLLEDSANSGQTAKKSTTIMKFFDCLLFASLHVFQFTVKIVNVKKREHFKTKKMHTPLQTWFAIIEQECRQQKNMAALWWASGCNCILQCYICPKSFFLDTRRFKMFVQIGFQSKGLVTPFTLKVFQCGMGLHMSPQIWPVCKCFSTMGTAIRLLTCVGSHMTLKEPRPWEIFSTN